jgi:hypothetical protein
MTTVDVVVDGAAVVVVMGATVVGVVVGGGVVVVGRVVVVVGLAVGGGATAVGAAVVGLVGVAVVVVGRAVVLVVDRRVVLVVDVGRSISTPSTSTSGRGSSSEVHGPTPTSYKASATAQPATTPQNHSCRIRARSGTGGAEKVVTCLGPRRTSRPYGTRAVPNSSALRTDQLGPQ